MRDVFATVLEPVSGAVASMGVSRGTAEKGDAALHTLSHIAKTIIHNIADLVGNLAAVTKGLVLSARAMGVDSAKAATMAALSDREQEGYSWIGKGLAATEISRKLGINVKTIETSQARIKEKLGLKDSTQLFQKADRRVQLKNL